MECTSCGNANLDDNRFCGACGIALTEELSENENVSQKYLLAQIERTVDAKLSMYVEREIVELRATEQIIDRAWKWITRFAYVVGVPVAAIGIVLGYLGIGSIGELKEMQRNAQVQLDSALEKAREIDRKANDASIRFADTAATIKNQAEKANAALVEVEKLQVAADEIARGTERQFLEMSQRADRLDEEFVSALAQLARIEEISDRIPEIEKEVAQVEVLKEEFGSLSKRLTAVEMFNNASAEKDPNRKIVLFSELLKEHHDHVDGYFYRALAYSDVGKYDLAIEDYTKVIALNPDHASSYNNRAIIYSERGLRDLAITDYGKAIALDPDDADFYTNRAIVYYDMRKYYLAVADYDKAIVFNPDDDRIYHDRAVIYGDLGEHKLAIADYDKAIALNPDRSTNYHYRGITYHDLGQHDLAIADYDKVIALSPGDVTVYESRARLWFDLGQFAKAENDLSMALQLDPSDSYTIIWRHFVSARLSHSDIDALRRDAGSVKLDEWPGHVISMYLGELAAKDVRDAAKHDDPTTELERQCEAEFYIGEFHLMTGQRGEARLLFQKAFETCPKTFIEYNGAKVELGRLAVD